MTQTVLACTRVEDMPIPNVLSEIELCVECRKRVWVAASSPRKAVRLCLQCAAPLIASTPDVRPMMTTEQAADIAAYYRARKKA